MDRASLAVALSRRLVLIVAALMVGCNGDSPTSPAWPGTTPSVWSAHGVRTSISGVEACGGTTPVVESIGYEDEWVVQIHGNVIVVRIYSRDPIDATDLTGTLNGQNFSVAYRSPDPIASGPCQFREISLVGSFSSNRRVLDASQVTLYASTTAEAREEWQWHATAR